jgi:hypothetical protein
MTVAEDHGTPGQDVVDVFPTVNVVDLRSLSMINKAGRRLDRFKGPDGAVDAPRDHLPGFLKETL